MKKMTQVVSQAREEIRRIVATAQDEIHMLQADFNQKTSMKVFSSSKQSSDQTDQSATLQVSTDIVHTCAVDSLFDNSFQYEVITDDSDMEGFTLHLDISCGQEDPDESEQYHSDQEVTKLSDTQNTSNESHCTLSIDASSDDVNLLFELNSDGFGISSDYLMNARHRSSVDVDHDPISSWRWSGIRTDSTHRMPQDTSSGKSQRADATWRRKWRSYCKPTELIPKQVIGHEHKVEPEHHPRKDISLHRIAQLTLCRLKVQLMGPAVRKQRRPLACWRYSKTSTHGILQQQDSRDWRRAEHHPGLHVNISN